MYTHFIFVAKSTYIRKKIALDFVTTDIKELNFVGKMDLIAKKYGGIPPVTIRRVRTDSMDWSSVILEDNKYQNVKLYNNLDDFVGMLLKDKQLNSIDIMNYILSRTACTHLKLEKLIYLCYADYLCFENKKLFLDQIYVLNDGPIILNVFKKMINSKLKIKVIFHLIKGEDDQKIYYKNNYYFRAKERIRNSENGNLKIEIIDKVIDKYKDYTGKELSEMIKGKTDFSMFKSFNLNKDKTLIDEVILRKYFSEY